MSSKILIVDDSKTTRNYLAHILRFAGYEVLEAVDGSQAIEILVSHPQNSSIRCIITDINMPVLDGITMIKRIRKELSLNLPIIVVTTVDERNEQRVARNLVQVPT
ncbi:response regulator [Fervidobacterium gondwanense]|uniref:Two-component system, chemotaxis family, response regulator CheY n=1 Tax=Fervidobacterium gondwanense DSM 13020 TaxID=1121883 RepID=A0A1M7T1K3_FERGO|nr:response regulator [Fervidobacterium gondwanense]SHN64665.1 two-component system, chemotaxis family, response regulator CheY [Fervidobacterium gondwanense DSM 13020]